MSSWLTWALHLACEVTALGSGEPREFAVRSREQVLAHPLKLGAVGAVGAVAV